MAGLASSQPMPSRSPASQPRAFREASWPSEEAMAKCTLVRECECVWGGCCTTVHISQALHPGGKKSPDAHLKWKHPKSPPTCPDPADFWDIKTSSTRMAHRTRIEAREAREAREPPKIAVPRPRTRSRSLPMPQGPQDKTGGRRRGRRPSV